MAQLQNFLELPFEFNHNKLLKDLQCVKNDEWISHPNTQAYDGSWLITSLTSTDGDTKNIIALENQTYKNTPLLQRTSYIKDVIDMFKTKVESVRFMKLSSHSIIKEHCDKGSGFEEGYARLHIPIKTNDDVEFILNGDVKKMQPAKCYYIDAHNPHSVINNGDSERVHLLIDVVVNDWLEDIFVKNGFKKPNNKYGDKKITDENVNQIIESLELLGTDTAINIAKNLD
jgi:hypothetical protein